MPSKRAAATAAAPLVRPKFKETNWDAPVGSAAAGKRSGRARRGEAAAAPAAGTAAAQDDDGSQTAKAGGDDDNEEEDDDDDGDAAAQMDTGRVEGADEVALVGKDESWYIKADAYWKNVPATVNGMLGGFEVLSEPDVAGSLDFIREFVDGPTARLQRNLALDCGAGIGRVTREFLLKVFERTDMVEQNPLFVEQAKSYVPPGRVENFFCAGLQSFVPQTHRYDAIWVQWVLGHLNDDDFVAFFERCKQGVRPGGLIFVKENIARSGFVVDEADSSMTRSNALVKLLFARAGLRVIKQTKQGGFPKGIFRVNMYALDWDRA